MTRLMPSGRSRRRLPPLPPPAPQQLRGRATRRNQSPRAQPFPPARVLISAHIDPIYTVAKDKAVACPDAGTFCLGIETELTGPDGELGSECNLSWNVKTAGRLFDQGRNQFCDESIYVGADKVMPAGKYELTINLDMDDGAQHTGSYSFELVPE